MMIINGKSYTKLRTLLILITLFLSSMCTIGDMAIVPIVGNLYSVFPQVNLVNAIVSMPAVVGVPFCFIGGILCDRTNKKYIMVTGFALFTVCTVFGCSVENVYYMLITRNIATGVAWGLTSSAAVSIIAEMFADEKTRGTINGLYNSTMTLIGAAMSMASGIMAVSGWQNAFRTYLPAIPILILLILFLPDMPAKKEISVPANKGNKPETENKSSLNWIMPLLPLLLQIFFIGACYYVIVFMISVYVTDTGIGNEAFTGSLSSIGTICSCIACAVFGFIYKKLNKATPLPSFAVIGAGFLVMAAFPVKAVALAACGIMGAAWGIFYSFSVTECTVIVPEEKQGIAIGIVGAFIGLASFLCSYLVTGLQAVMGVTNVLPVFTLLGVVALTVFVISTVMVLSQKGKKK